MFAGVNSENVVFDTSPGLIPRYSSYAANEKFQNVSYNMYDMYDVWT